MGNLDLTEVAIAGLDEDPWCSGPGLDTPPAGHGAAVHVALHQLAQQFRMHCHAQARPRTLAALLKLIIRAAMRAFDASTQDALGASRFGAENLRCLSDLVQLMESIDAEDAVLPPRLSHALDPLIIQLIRIDPSQPDVTAVHAPADTSLH